jgi:hypothetical protein
MTDWREAGRKADAHRIRDLYRGVFGSDAKNIARQRVIDAMRAAGVTTVLDLWGGGISSTAFVKAGFRVISVDDGSMEIMDHGQPVRRNRKRRALEYTASEDGYEARFGKVEAFAGEADGAYLDFCGPWSASARRAVVACRHMKCVAVTLTPDHDVSTDATTTLERQAAYQLFLRMAWTDQPVWRHISGSNGVRRLLDYRRARGYAVFLYLLSHQRINLPPLKHSERAKTKPEMYARRAARSRRWYEANRDRILEHQRTRQRPRLGPFSLTCRVCGNGFVSVKSIARYCSKPCWRSAKTERQNERYRARSSGVSGTPDKAIND